MMVASAAGAAHAWTDETAPVRAIVRRAWRAVALRRAMEALSIGVAAGLVCSAACIASGGDAIARGAWIAACTVGSLAALSWWLEHAPEEFGIARRLDEDGALLTAYECELAGTRSPLRALLSRRVASEVAASRPRVARGPSPLVVAVLLGAGALLALAVESSESPRRSDLVDARRRAFEESARTLALEVESASAGHSSQSATELRALAQSAAALAGAPDRGAELLAFADRAEEALRTESKLPPVRAALERAAAAARSLATVLGDGDGSASGGRSSNGSAAARRGGGASGAGEGAGSGTDMRGGTSDVTMLRPDPGAVSDPAARAADEHGLPAVRWWPRQFDVIVERWVEHQRASGDR